MKTNIIKTFLNLKKENDFKLNDIYSGANKVNNVGTGLEYFVKDLFCGTLQVKGLPKKDKAQSKFISYFGNQNNPPDFILKNSDAVEVKKIESTTTDIQLNSSYPKSKLYADDSRIKASCKACDNGNWNKKDIIYVVGSVINKKIKLLWFVYGDCYAADRSVYLDIFNKISDRIYKSKDIEFGKTKELAGVKKVDPLGITYLRVRGMWGINSPHKVFGNLVDYNPANDFSAYALILKNKFDSLPNEDIKKIKESLGNVLKIKDVEIKSPDNPAKYLKAKLLSIVK